MNAPDPLKHIQKRAVPQALLDALKSLLGDRLSIAMAVREHHGRDESPFPLTPPDAVVFAHSSEEVAAVVKLCAQHRTPVIPYGAGSSLEGNYLPVYGGVMIDVSQMNQVLTINAEDLTVTVQAGVTRKQLNDAIKDTGLFFPIDPGADASLGGMSATRASGTNAVRYGTMRENVIRLTVVTASGEIIRTASRAKKSSAGYDLTRIFVGSEGTLGVITEITVKLYPQPEAIRAATCNFPTVEAAVQATIETIQMGVPIARVELLDVNAVKALNAHSKLGLMESPMLLCEFHGSENSVTEQVAITQEIAQNNGAQGFQWAATTEERNKLWTARHQAYFATMQLRAGARSVTTDVCVPISRLAECVRETCNDLARGSLLYAIVGHVGDGNFHVQMLIDPAQQSEWDEAEAINSRLVERAISMDGTCTGEHGIGLHKMDFLIQEHGAVAVDLMRTLKHAFDPLNIMNPGKIVRW